MLPAHLKQLVENGESVSLVLSLIDDSRADWIESQDELEALYSSHADAGSVAHIELFVAILHHLLPDLPSEHIISVWFDLILRPALKDPRLPLAALEHARQLVLAAAVSPAYQYSTNEEGDHDHDHSQPPPERVMHFRKMLFDLYLFDAFNETSEYDVLEWAQLQPDEQKRRNLWKSNLQSVLMAFATACPNEFLTHVNEHFLKPSSRVQLHFLLNSYASLERHFQPHAKVMAQHPIMSSLLSSLLLDNSSTLCTFGLTLMGKLLPVFAVHAPSELKQMLPRLLAILGRVICWRSRGHPGPDEDVTGDEAEEYDEDEEEPFPRVNPPTASHLPLLSPPPSASKRKYQPLSPSPQLELRSDLPWERLESSFHGRGPSPRPPAPCPYFTVLYYLFPCNVLRWMRNPVAHLEQTEMESPYTVPWSEALVEDEIKANSEPILKRHICHPLIIRRDAATELAAPDFFRSYDVARIVSEASLLDIRTAAVAVREMDPSAGPSAVITPFSYEDAWLQPSGHQTPHQISLEAMIKTSVLLKSGVEVGLIDRPSRSSMKHWLDCSPGISHSRSRTVTSFVASPMEQEGEEEEETAASAERGADEDDNNPADDKVELDIHHESVANVITGLQREILLLRNELNFEAWLSREHTKNIGRLYRDQTAMHSADIERLGLYNKLRKYRSQVMELEKALQEQRNAAVATREQSADYNGELQLKLREFREQKKAWIAETASLRAAEKEAKAQTQAQALLLEAAAQELFSLKTYKKENQHKIERLHDYEKQIEEYVANARTWDEDFAKFKAREEEVAELTGQLVQMAITLKSYEQTLNDLQDVTHVQEEQLRRLRHEANQKAVKNTLLTRTRSSSSGVGTATSGKSSSYKERELDHLAEEKNNLQVENLQLRSEKQELLEEVEDLRSMVEYLKSQAAGKSGLLGGAPSIQPSMSESGESGPSISQLQSPI